LWETIETARKATVTKESIRVLIVEEPPTWCARDWVALLNVVDGLEVVGEAADGVEAIAQFRKHQPAITLIDLRLSATERPVESY